MYEKRALSAAPLVRLDGLHAVPWADLEDAYGRARNVPYFIEALSSPDAEDRAWGLDALWASVNHQGHPSEASPHVVPFLLRMLDAPQLPDRAGLLAFIVEMAVGDSRWCFEAGTDLAKFTRTFCYEAVTRGETRILAALGHEEAAVRANAARGCAMIPDFDAKSLPLLEAMVRDEHDRGAKLTARVALSVVATRMGKGVVDAAEWARADDFWERAAGLTAVAYALGTDTPPATIELLASVGARIPTAFERMDGRTDPAAPPTLMWELGTTLRAQHITASIPTDLDGQIARAGEGDPDAFDPIANEAATRALETLVALADCESPWLFEELDPRLQALLRVMAGRRRLVVRPAEAVRSLYPSGAWLRRFVGLDGGPLDERHDFGHGRIWPVWRSLYGCMVGELDPASWAASMAGDRVALVEDLIKNRYWPRSIGALANLDVREGNATESQVWIMLARWLADTPDGIAWARERAPALIADAMSSRPHDELVTALVLGFAARDRDDWLEPEFEPLVRTDHVPAWTYAPAIGAALATMAPASVERCLAEMPLHRISTTAKETPGERIECAYIYFLPQWDVLPALATPLAGRRVLEELLTYEAHRRKHATRPERDQFPGVSDQPFPRELALATFRAIGPTSRVDLEAHRDQVEDATFIEEALGKINARPPV